MKNHLRKAAAILMALLTTITMSACSKINSETAADVREALEAKYGKAFEVTHIGNRLNNSTATAFAHPVDQSEIVFTATIDHDGNVVDDYANHIVLNTIEKELVHAFQANGIASAVNAVVTEDDVIETDTDISPNAFASKNGIDAILVRVILDGPEVSARSVIDSLEEAAASYEFSLVVSLYVMPHEAFVTCEKDFQTYPSVGATKIESYSPVFSSKLVLSDGGSSVSVEQLAVQMEGN